MDIEPRRAGELPETITLTLNELLLLLLLMYEYGQLSVDCGFDTEVREDE